MRRLHRWLGVITSLVVVVLAVSGLALRHPDLAARVLAEPQRPGVLADRTTALAADPRDPARLLVGTARGLFESRDGGRTWRDVILQMPATDVVAVAFDPAAPARMLLATADGGVFVSEDGGEFWDDASVPPEALTSRLQAASFGAAGAVVVRAGSGVYRRDASGVWSRVAGADHAARSRLAVVAALHGGSWPHAAMGIAVDVSALALLVLVFSGWVLAFQRQSRRWRRR